VFGRDSQAHYSALLEAAEVTNGNGRVWQVSFWELTFWTLDLGEWPFQILQR